MTTCPTCTNRHEEPTCPICAAFARIRELNRRNKRDYAQRMAALRGHATTCRSDTPPSPRGCPQDHP